jgi:hypothetical protein
VLYISLLLAVVAHASPLQTLQEKKDVIGRDPLQIAGTVFSWLSTLLYLGSRFPQLYKNHKRKSTSGLSPTLFIAAFFGNLFYSSSMLTNPNAWNDYGPYGGGGWVDADGNNRTEWVARATPFFLGAAGVLIMDASVGLQFLYFGEQAPAPVVVIEERKGRKWRWRRVSGWMRGWMPSVSVAGTPRLGTPRSGTPVGKAGASSSSEREALLANAIGGPHYGGV